MIPVKQFSSSSIGSFGFCEQKYFISYVLGKREKTGKKALLGTICHKVLEVLALCKKFIQDNPNQTLIKITDDELGELVFDKEQLFSYKLLSEEEILYLNSINKDKTWLLKTGSKRMGAEVVNELIKTTYEFYKTSHSDLFKFENADFKSVNLWTWTALDYNDGMYDPRNKNVINPEHEFAFDIDFPWAKYDFSVGEEKFSGNLKLKGVIDLVVDLGDDAYEIIDWKGLPTTTPILTINGWSTMGDLCIGDVVFDKDGQKTKVLAKSKKSYKTCYQIDFDDKTSAVCDYEHLWLLDDNTVVETPNLKVNDKIDIAKPLDFEEAELPIDPYLFGVWLGDGRNRSMDISGSDDFIFEEIERRGFKLGSNTSCRDGIRQHVVLNQTSILKQLGVLHNKHIPDIYKRSSYNQRLDLLRGLMDSDGNVNSIRKQAVFTSCNKNLSNDVKELLLSLGQRVNQSSIKVNTKFKNTKYTYKNVKVYPLHFRPININPFLLPRKANCINEQWGPGYSNKRKIVKITKLQNKLETQCIMVDSPSNTYLCTRDMIPTHNTGQRLDWATGEEKTYNKLQSDSQLLIYYYAATKLFPKIKSFILTIFFLRDGGPFSIHFDGNDIKNLDAYLSKFYQTLQDRKVPKLIDPSQNNFKCSKLCEFYKEKVDGTNYCLFIHNEIKSKGIEQTIIDNATSSSPILKK